MKKILFIIAIGLSLYSCSDEILDIPPKDRIAESAVWSDAALIRSYHNQIYAGIDHSKGPNMMAKATDEMCFNDANRYPGPILNATLDPDNVTDRANFRGGGSVYTWDKDYEVVREILVFLDRMETDEVLTEDERKVLVAEARIIRAYMYSRLIVRFGGVPIIEDVLELDDELTFSRNTIDECVTYIEADIEAAMPDLPAVIYADEGEFGRVTQSAAKAILSRLYLHMASPLFNPSNDLAKWKKAADAAWDLIDDGYFSLHPDYTTLFNAPSGSPNNELIWGRNYTQTNAHDQPMYMLGRRWGAYGGWGGAGGISQNLVDDYEMINGEPPFIKVNHVNTTINPASGYDPQNPYANRDPRFYQSVNFDGTVFREETLEKWVASDESSWGFDSYKESGDNPRSNYTLRKFMPGTDTEPILNWDINYTSPFHFFRLGEIYLNYAEAMFELGNEGVCREYLNYIRARPTVEMPPVPDSVTGEELRSRLYNERRIELAFEEHRYFDVRRWGIAQYTEAVDLYGMDIILDVDTGEKNYSPVLLFDRAWDDKLNFLPISRSEVQITGVEQTPGYN
ncbi:RagB/SusD family nutrient uptake outer membrane protein [Zobellia galactanivorans]|uniref:RagB/SusD family nutrient uptake outer membrane protein n=1 Tax=Zobellia galactanivorans (strain DSM 12802 / CCUG 47099 / CIP 106680 / NCIMB 13871 / Dsij) TaxID=63186 RepID=UPI0026E45147|nr:RagB/SusD family nutrient uptake outer membrane protein [Zobellia galactanivorans]MDO6809764.1 RagB/SusD family nutrient uptake outer membrane protein [Zobellia galactanivorans]